MTFFNTRYQGGLMDREQLRTATRLEQLKHGDPNDFHVTTGEYDPGWQERETANRPFDRKLLDLMGDELKRQLENSHDPKTYEIVSVHAPRWFVKAWAAIISKEHGEDRPITVWGKPLLTNDSDTYGVEVEPIS